MKEEIIKIDWINLFYKEFGSKNTNSTIIILHWWWWNSNSWIDVWDLLASSWNRVIIPDLPWFWNTNLTSVFSLEKYSKLIIKLAKKLKLSNIVLIGHSNWWAISIKISTSSELKIKKLILNNSAWIRNNSLRTIKRKLLLNFSKLWKKVLKLTKLENNSFYKKFRINFYKLIGSVDYVNSEKSIYLNETYKNIISSDLRNTLWDIKIKTYLIWWSKDSYTPLSDWYIFNKLIKDSKLIILKKQKHWIHIFNPKLLAENILNIL